MNRFAAMCFSVLLAFSFSGVVRADDDVAPPVANATDQLITAEEEPAPAVVPVPESVPEPVPAAEPAPAPEPVPEAVPEQAPTPEPVPEAAPESAHTSEL